jgi:Zn-dependent M28 family amino/carboxypeptidase
MNKRWKLFIAVFVSFILVICQPLQLFSAEIVFKQKDIQQFSLIANLYDKQDALRLVSELTKDDYGGRSSSTEGCDKAAQWIADQYKKWNLLPFQGESYFQKVESALSVTTTSNVIGYIPSLDRESKASIIIGAHYDHIGKGRSGAIYRGANDNASGTGVMMEFAATLSKSFLISHINIVFIAFSAEEKGLLGSYYYVKNPLFPINQVLAMINLDMVGTGIGPWEIATNFEKVKTLNYDLNRALAYYKSYYRLCPGYLRPVSDHYPFFQQGVPVLFIIRSNPSNIGGYHTLKDTIDTIDIKNLEECGKIVVLIVLLVGKDRIKIVPKFELQNQSHFYPFLFIGSYPVV